MGKILEFEKRETVCVDIDELADILDNYIGDILYDRQGLTIDDLQCLDYEAIKIEISKKWLAEVLKKD